MSNRIWSGVESLGMDIRFSIRALAKSPGFVAVAVLTLALGIGASATVFSVAKSLVMDPVSYVEADRLVDVWTNQGQPLSTPDFLDMSKRNTCFSSMGVINRTQFNLGGEKPESVWGISGTPSVLPLLGVPPLLGRWFNEADAEPKTPQSVIISHGLWTRAFAKDPSVLGRTIRLNGSDLQVVGVMPETFLFQSARTHGREFHLWVPMHLEMKEEDRGSHWLEAFARLKPGVSLQQADEEVRRIGAQLKQEHPLTNQNKPFLARSLVAEVTNDSRNALPLLLGAVGLVLLMACANVASMLLARGSHRQQEFAVRFSMGATRSAVVRLCLTESLLLALLGTLGGIAVASFGTGFLHKVLAIPDSTGLHVDATLLVIGSSLALATTFISGIPAALAAARAALFETMKDGGRGHAGSKIRQRFLKQLVAAQIVLAFLLVNGALLLSSSYLKVWNNNRQLDTDRTITAGVTLTGTRYLENSSRVQFWERFLERVRAIPGVKEAGMTNKLPLEGGNNWSILVEGEIYDPAARRPWVENARISPGYFEAMGIPLLRGRVPGWQTQDTGEINDSEDNPGKQFTNVVVNRAFVERYWPGQNPIGKRFWINDANPSMIFTVVGEVENTRQWDAEHPVIPEMYRPYPVSPASNTTLVVRSSMDARKLVPALRQELAVMDSDLAFARIRTSEELLSDSTKGRRLMMQVINGFMALAVVLALGGIYGTVSYNIARRNKEVGVRMVLGAQRLDIIRLFFRQILPSVLIGVVLGVIGSLACIRFIRSFVFEINPANPWFFALIALGIFSVSAFIAWLPAVRAARAVPMDALKAE